MRLRQIRGLDAIPAAAWDRCFEPAYPFTRHAWLAALEAHRCVSPETGWEPDHLIAEDEAGQLIGAVPLYRKQHSYGEFVFDFAWADASYRLGQPYYPKLLCAIPFVPSGGPRIGAADPAVRKELVRALLHRAEHDGLSSLHALFVDDDDAQTLRAAGLLERHDLQFQWRNQGYADMPAFLATLNSQKRKKLLRERRRVDEAGIGFECVRGTELDAAQWDRVYALYASTYLERGQMPYFTRDFLADVGTRAELDLRLVLAQRADSIVAVALLLVGGDTLYGRHWGADAQYHSLHFECCYYQGIELCLREGLQRFDAGTQGAHKHGRGFEPVLTRSYHWLRDQRLHAAVRDYLHRERAATAARHAEFMQHTPYRSTDPTGVRSQG